LIQNRCVFLYAKNALTALFLPCLAEDDFTLIVSLEKNKRAKKQNESAKKRRGWGLHFTVSLVFHRFFGEVPFLSSIAVSLDFFSVSLHKNKGCISHP